MNGSWENTISIEEEEKEDCYGHSNIERVWIPLVEPPKDVGSEKKQFNYPS